MRRTLFRFQSGRARVFGILVLIAVSLFAVLAYAKTRAVESPGSPERSGHTATLLADGRVLVVGGESGGEAITRTEIYDAGDGSTSGSGRTAFSRSGHSATLLPDGRVLVAGGRNGVAVLDSAEAWSPETASFAMVSRMNVPRAGHVAVALADGRVLIAGGDAEGTMELFDGSSFERLGIAPRGPRSGASAVQLLDGRVLVAGGRDGEGMPLASADLIDLRDGLVTRVSMKAARIEPVLSMLPDGKVQVIGGDAEATMEIFGAGRFTALTVLRALDPRTIAATRARFAFDRGEATTIEVAIAGRPSTPGSAKGGIAISKSRAVRSGGDGAWVTTDQADYAPGQTVTVTGGGFAPGETVTLIFERNPETSPATTITVTADANGGFTNSDYVCLPTDAYVTFTLTAVGQASGARAVTAFTDAPPTVTVGAQSGTLTYGTAGSATFPVSVDSDALSDGAGSCAAYSFTLSVTAGLHASITPSFSALSLSATNNLNSNVGGFENITGGYYDGTTQDGWSFSANSNSGVTTGGLGAPGAAAGTAAGFLQRPDTISGNSSNAVISRSITLPAGDYLLSFKTAQRDCCAAGGTLMGVTASYNGASTGNVSPAYLGGYQTVTLAITGDGAAHDLTFTGSGAGNVLNGTDVTVFIDDIRIYSTCQGSSTLTLSTTTETPAQPSPGTNFTVQANGGGAGSDTDTEPLIIDRRAITVTAQTASKGYDCTTSSSVSPAVTLGTLAPGDVMTADQTYDNKNVAGSPTKTMTVGTVTITDGGDVTSNYDITKVSANVGEITKANPTVTASYASGSGTYIYDEVAGVPVARSITGTATGCDGDLTPSGPDPDEGSIAYWYQGTLANGLVNGYGPTNTAPTDAGYYTAYTRYTDVSGNYNDTNSASIPIHINKATPQAILTPNLTIFDFYENGVDREVEDDPLDPLQGEGGLVQVTGINNTIIQNPVAVGDTYHYAANDQACPHTSLGTGPPPDINLAWSNTGYDEAGYYVIGADYAGTNNYIPLDNVNSCVTSACTPVGNNYVYEITVTSEGAGYTPGTYVVPIVPVAGGAGATASAVVDVYGKVKFVTITAAGSGYANGATVNLSGIPGGAGAAATVRIATPQGLGSAAVVVTNGGTGYANSFAVSFTGGGCTLAPTGTATAVGGVVQSVAINTNGAGCTSAPVVNFSAGGGFGALASVRFPASPKAGVFRINGAPHTITGPFVTNAPYDGETKLGVQDITLVARHVYAAPHANAGQPTFKQLKWETYNSDNAAVNPSWYCSVSNVQGPDANGDTTVTLRINHATPDPTSVCRVRAFYDNDCDFAANTQWTQDVFINPAQLLVSWAAPSAIDTSTPLGQIPVPVYPSVSNPTYQLNAAVYWINDQNGTATPTLAGVYPDSPYCDSVFPFVLTGCPAPSYLDTYSYYPPAGTTLPQGTQTLSLNFTTRSAGGVNNPDFITPVAYNQYITVNAPPPPPPPPPPPAVYCDVYHNVTVPSRSITVTTLAGLDQITSLGLFKDTDVGSFVSGTGMPAYASIIAVVDDSTAIISGAATMTGARTVSISTTVPALKTLPTRSFTGVTTGGSTTVLSVAAPYGFTGYDIGRTISGTGIPAGATIVGVTTGFACGSGPATCSAATISAAATRTGSAMMTMNGGSDGPMRGMVAGDFNGDGFQDLVVANNSSLAWYQGRGDTLLPDGGDGTFYPPVEIATGFVSLYEMVLGDFVTGGSMEFAVTDAGTGQVHVYSTDGANPPTFTLESTLAVGGTPYSLTSGDMDGAGGLDLVVTDAANYNVQIWLGDGAGNFSQVTPAGLNAANYTLNAGNKPWGVVVGNFFGGADGINDVMVALNGTTNSVAMLRGDGTGRFVSLSKIIKNVNGPYPRTLAVGDLDVDGDDDVLVGNYGNTATTPTGSVYKMLQAGDGTGNFTISSAAAVVRPSSIVIGDIVDDGGVPDFAVVSATANAVFMFRGTGGGNFTAFKNNTTGVKATGAAPYTVVLGDFDDVGGDGRVEVVTNGSTDLKVFAANQSPTATVSKLVSARSFTATTTLSTTINSSGFFRALDATLLATITSSGIPAGTTITGYTSNNQVTMSAAATLAGARTVTVTQTDTAAPFNVFTGGKAATITVDFTGTGPYTLKWSDGLTQTTANSSITRTVTTSVNKTYTITSVTGASSCGGSAAAAPANSATLTVTP